MDEHRRPSPDQDPTSLVGAAVLAALELIDLPAYVIDPNGTLRWANEAASRLLGFRVGDSFCSCASPESRQVLEEQLARKLGGDPAPYTLTVVDPDGRGAQLRVHSAPLRRTDSEILGVFGLAMPRERSRRQAAKTSDDVQLTRRQAEVLGLLAEGLSTEAIASQLGVAVETARNHIRAVLRNLGVHSRLEAVVEGRERGLLDE